MKLPGNTLPKQVPNSLSVATLLSLTNTGSTGAVTSQSPTLTRFDNDDAVLYHEGLLRVQVRTTGGKGATPTAVGASKTLTFYYAFTDDLLNAVADAPTILSPVASTLVCSLPNASSIRAFGTLTFTGLPSNTQTVTIDTKVYTFVTALSGTANEVIIGADAAACAANLIAAINAAAGAGTTYGLNTAAHTLVTAATGGSGVVTVTSIYYDTSGNAISTTETCSNASWGGATLASGSAAGSAIFATASFTHLGRYLYTWFDRTSFAANALIDVAAKLIRL